MIAIALGQMLMSFNVVLFAGGVERHGEKFQRCANDRRNWHRDIFDGVAGFVMLGAKLNQRFGSQHVLRTVIVLFGAAQVLMTFNPNATLMITAQGLSGAAGPALFGIGQGSLVTLVFNVLATASPKELAGDVGSLRGTAKNLAAAVGTAVAGALLVGLLSAGILRGLTDNPSLPPEFQSQVDLDSITFVSNDRLQVVMERTTATPVEIAEAVRINTDARLRALKMDSSSWQHSHSSQSFQPNGYRTISLESCRAIRKLH
jgi:hypothetical protein